MPRATIPGTRLRGARAPPVRGAAPGWASDRLAHLQGCAAFLRRCRRLLPVSAAGSDLWNHHTSPARSCSAAVAAPLPPQSPLFVPPPRSTASAARFSLLDGPPLRPPGLSASGLSLFAAPTAALASAQPTPPPPTPPPPPPPRPPCFH